MNFKAASITCDAIRRQRDVSKKGGHEATKMGLHELKIFLLFVKDFSNLKNMKIILDYLQDNSNSLTVHLRFFALRLIHIENVITK